MSSAKTPSRYACKACGKSFSENKHLMAHVSDKNAHKIPKASANTPTASASTGSTPAANASIVAAQVKLDNQTSGGKKKGGGKK